VRRAWWVWVWFAAGAGAMTAAMAWLTQDVHALVRMSLEADRRVRTDAAARAALWRIDTTLAAFIAGDDLVPPPDAAHPPLGGIPLVRFERREDGSWMIHVPRELGDSGGWIRRLQGVTPEEKSGYAAPPQQLEQQVAAQQGDFQERQVLTNGNAFAASSRLGPPRVMRLGDDALAIVRSGAGCAAAGRVLPLDGLQRTLTVSIADLLPDARILPCPDPAKAEYPLATVPLRLEPGALPLAPAGPLVPTLTVAWVAVIAVILAMAALLAGAMALAERRAAFVSAVTHELRTPITSLRLYADMLGEGMVADEARRGEYLATIRSEAERLGRLVENVLAYARLERSAAVAAAKPIPVAELVATCRERLERRAREAGMELVVDLAAAAEAIVRIDPTLVEQALFNLVDNAAKYAGTATDRRIELRAERQERGVALIVSDHGPGIAADVRSRLFRPFSRSAREAAGSAPGVGLGLALSRRLARQLGGDLALMPSSEGARFALTLPLA
jgi:signal transduction histidine kinase